MQEQRVIEVLPYGSNVEIDGKTVYVPRLLNVRSGRIVRHLNGGPEWRATSYSPATTWKLAEWDLQHLTAWERGFRADAQDVLCYAEDNPDERD